MRLAIVGCGLIGAKARRPRRRRTTIVVVCDRDAARAATARATYRQARAVTDWREAVKADVDAVIVATTHDQLAAIALGAVEAGRHVLVEKPAGRTLPRCRPSPRRRQACRIVKVGFNHRFHPAFLKAREIVDAGALGPLMFIRARYGHGGRLGYEKEWRAQPEISGGGELIDQGSHLIDLSRWFLGDLTRRLRGGADLFWNMPVDDNCFMALRSGRANGVAARVLDRVEEHVLVRDLRPRRQAGDRRPRRQLRPERLTFYRMLPQMGPPETTIWEFPGPDQSWRMRVCRLRRAINESRRALRRHRRCRREPRDRRGDLPEGTVA